MTSRPASGRSRLVTRADMTNPSGTIEVHRAWKRFREDRPRPQLSDQLSALTSRVRNGQQWRWVLRDVDFKVEPGEAVAFVGTNGAGKSTLLKLLTRVMYPYAGSISLTGRVGALIEIRGGLHPDLTGRENIAVYGTLLGLSRREVADRFDDIVDFADLSKAIDRQLKFYSSGMQMRLGFAVAAFLNPDVLLVDEVLAVGDAWFQQRCLDRMREVLHQGTTLVLVSHDLAALETICDRALWFDSGVLTSDGPVRDVLSTYRRSIEDRASGPALEGTPVELQKIEIGRPDGGLPTSHSPLQVDLRLRSPRERKGRLHIGVSEGASSPTFLVSTAIALDAGTHDVRCVIDDIPLPRGRFSVWVHMESGSDDDLIPWHPAASFHVAGTDLDPAPRGVVRPSPVHVRSEWTHELADPSES